MGFTVVFFFVCARFDLPATSICAHRWKTDWFPFLFRYSKERLLFLATARKKTASLQTIGFGRADGKRNVPLTGSTDVHIIRRRKEKMKLKQRIHSRNDDVDVQHLSSFVFSCHARKNNGRKTNRNNLKLDFFSSSIRCVPPLPMRSLIFPNGNSLALLAPRSSRQSNELRTNELFVALHEIRFHSHRGAIGFVSKTRRSKNRH